MIPPSGETGTATVLVAVASGLFIGLASLVAALVVVAAIRIVTETAADAAALAAVGASVAGDDGCRAAARFARVNGGRLVECHCPEFVGAPLVARVVVARVVEVPLVGERTVRIERSAEYRPGP